MAKTKSGGTARGNRDSASQRLGIKIYDGQKVKIGMIIVRQRGTHYLLGRNVKKGSDDTIYSMADGVVKFSSKIKKLYDGSSRTAKTVSVEPIKSK